MSACVLPQLWGIALFHKRKQLGASSRGALCTQALSPYVFEFLIDRAEPPSARSIDASNKNSMDCKGGGSGAAEDHQEHQEHQDGAAAEPEVAVQQPAPVMDVMGDANLGAVMLILMILGLLHQQMRDPCTC